MKKALLGFGAGFLVAILLVSVYAFQTEIDTDVVIMNHSMVGLKISHGNGETRKLDIGLLGSTKRGFENQTAFAKVLQGYASQGYSVETATLISGGFQYILTKN